MVGHKYSKGANRKAAAKRRERMTQAAQMAKCKSIDELVNKILKGEIRMVTRWQLFVYRADKPITSDPPETDGTLIEIIAGETEKECIEKAEAKYPEYEYFWDTPQPYWK